MGDATVIGGSDHQFSANCGRHRWRLGAARRQRDQLRHDDGRSRRIAEARRRHHADQRGRRPDQSHGGTVTIEIDTNTNVNSGTIEAVNGGEVDFHINVDGGSNYGLIEAGAGGTVHFFDNHGGGGGGGGQGGNHGTMEAMDGGVLIFDGGLDNFDQVDAFNGGLVYLNDGIKNHAGTVDAAGAGSAISISGDDNQSENADQIHAEHDGVISLASVMLRNDAGAMIEATSGGSISWIYRRHRQLGTFSAGNNGTITFGGNIGITNEIGGIFQAALGGSIVFGASDTGSVTNDGGTIVATDGGTITFDSTLNAAQNIDGGIIEAGTGGTIVIDGFSTGFGLFNSGGTIEAVGTGAKVELVGAMILGGTIESSGNGIIEAVSGTNTFMNVTIDGGDVKIDPARDPGPDRRKRSESCPHHRRNGHVRRWRYGQARLHHL